MKPILSTVVIFALFLHVSAQIKPLDTRKHFQFRDTSFEVDEVKILTPYIYNSRELSSLDSLEIFLYYHPALKVEAGSHTDNKGNDKYNLRLSQARAQSIVNYLISKGIPIDRLSAKGYGETLFISPNQTPEGKDYPEGRQLNRRTELKITSIDPTKENFFYPALLSPQLPLIHFLFGENSSAFALSLSHVRDIERVIDSCNEIDSSFLAQYKSCARSYVGFIDAAGDSVIMTVINFSRPQRTERKSLFDNNALNKTQTLFINLSRKICIKSFDSK